MGEKKKINKSCLAYIAQALNFITILGILAVTIVRFTFFAKENPPKDPFYYILTFYLIPFAGLLLIAELRWEVVLKHFEFLSFQWGKGMFMIFVGLLLFDTAYPVDSSISIMMIVVGIFNMILMCVAPGL